LKHDATYYALLGAGWLAAIVAGIVLWRLGSELPQAMPLDEFQRTVAKLRSDAFEARALALQLADGQLTEGYAIEQHKRLRHDLENVRKALDKPPPRAHEGEASQLKTSIDRLDKSLESVPAAMADAAELQRLAAEDAAVAKALPPTPP